MKDSPGLFSQLQVKCGVLAKTLHENPVNLFDELTPAAARRINADWLFCLNSP